MNIAHLSDLHFGVHDSEAAASLVADVAAAAPHLTVVTGDLTMRARPAEFRLARAFLDRLPSPVLVVTGNHDLPLDSPARLFRPYDRYRAAISAELDPVVHVPGLTAVGLQSMPRWRWKDGRVRRSQVTLVESTFAAAPPGDLRLVALHHPPFGRMLMNGRALLGAGADLLLAGHTHHPDVRPMNGTTVVVAGTSTSRRTRLTPSSWSRIATGDGVITVTERHFTGGGWQTARLLTVPA
ncbi:metallophosphoesterase [Actinoplanes cyaneus]|uniref:Metallophosphoesterase n=1 Tax=Actinoplanes cyaneus TaxID=52696 RepID=A0A919IRH0_9ACTN|nr:metallophosphoesterase [Actinoplanes cyaneus]MCW2143993.1 3',5'-cyclic AMP phosphodiesterase CpdA [Actinoplanes cyaneus]GID70829.1 metallophosphoesterase [Actinoplanes cyaneus]